MFSSFFVDPKACNLHTVTEGVAPEDLFGPLEADDLQWVCPGGFSTETHTYYHFLEDGKMLMCQVIHSAVGLWYPTVQFTTRIYDPATKEHVWRSSNVSGFVSPMPGSSDRHTCKSDKFTISYKPGNGTTEDTYMIVSNATDDLQLTLEVSRPVSVAGFKVGKGPKGGNTFFGADVNKPEGYVFHKFWPRTTCKGTIVFKGQAIAANGVGMFVHAIQGMRPNLVASRWNFATFASPDHGGVSAVMMEFTSTPDFGKQGNGSGGVVVNVGSIVVDGTLRVVTGETQLPGEVAAEDGAVQSRAIHHDPVPDPDTGYNPPTRISYHWSGPSTVAETPGTVKAVLDLPLGAPSESQGLIEKVDVLQEIPKVVKSVIGYVAGVKPYIYTYMNEALLSITLPNGDKVDVKGAVFNEATFIS